MIHLVRRSSAKTAAAAPYALSRTSAIRHLVDRRGARGADGRVLFDRADVGGVFPAAFALLSGGTLDFDTEFATIGAVQSHLRNDEESGQLTRISFEERI